MNIKRILGTLATFLFVVALAFGMQVDSARADIPGTVTFEYNAPQVLPQYFTQKVTNTPETVVFMQAKNLSSEYTGDLLLTYLEESVSFKFPANDPQPITRPFNPNNSTIQVTNLSTSRSSRIQYLFIGR